MPSYVGSEQGGSALTITTDLPPWPDLVGLDPQDAELIAVIGGGLPAFDVYVELTGGNAIELLDRAQEMVIGSATLTATYCELVDAHWPPVSAEDVFPIAPYGVDEGYDPLDLDGAA